MVGGEEMARGRCGGGSCVVVFETGRVRCCFVLEKGLTKTWIEGVVGLGRERWSD